MSWFVPLFIIHKFHNLHSDDITRIQWSPDSRFLLTMGKDLNIKLVNLHKIDGYVPITLSAHRNTILHAFFSDSMKTIFSISKDGMLLIWKWTEELVSEEYKRQLQFTQKKFGKRIKLDEPKKEEPIKDMEYYSAFEKIVLKGRFVIEKKERFELSGAKIKSVTHNTQANIMAIGMTNGVFAIYSIDPFKALHSFKISETN